MCERLMITQNSVETVRVGDDERMKAMMLFLDF
jgi:hypothetical protein